MKKLISLLLVLCMACMLIPAMAEDSAAGTWYLTEAIDDGVSVNPSAIGMSWTITLSDDGTAASVSITSDEKEEYTGTWTQDGATVTVTIDGSDAPFTFTDGKLVLDMGDNSQLLFAQEAPGEAAAAGTGTAPSVGVAVAEVNPEAAVEDFNGVWAPKYAGVNGMVIDASLVGQEMPGVVLKDGALVFTGDSSITTAFRSKTLALEYADGALSFSVSAGSMSLSVKAEMLQDGMMAVTFDVGMSLVLYMEKTGEAPESLEAPAA